MLYERITEFVFVTYKNLPALWVPEEAVELLSDCTWTPLLNPHAELRGQARIWTNTPIVVAGSLIGVIPIGRESCWFQASSEPSDFWMKLFTDMEGCLLARGGLHPMGGCLFPTRVASMEEAFVFTSDNPLIGGIIIK